MRSVLAVLGAAALTTVLVGCSSSDAGSAASSTPTAAASSAAPSSSAEGFVEVPDVAGLTGEEAVAALEAAGLAPSPLTDAQLTQPVRGTIPPAGDRTAVGATVVVLPGQ
ncbi:PASTA domain-containing protein [Cellulomonas endophytica]|uniref:PASTA domain-containing protein n=1 Tax=Cellulomonas endophytica TaxID=2494735 RepID=UPI0010127FB4|nr:PASTA domain-containing protein [Cellulomonas endophytica]